MGTLLRFERPGFRNGHKRSIGETEAAIILEHRHTRPITPEQLADLTGDYAAIGRAAPRHLKAEDFDGPPPLVCHRTRTVNLTPLRLAGSFALATFLTGLIALIMAMLP